MKHLHTTPARPAERLERPLPRDLEDVILACLCKDPADRPQSASAMRQALDTCADAGQWSQADSEDWWSGHGVEPDGGEGEQGPKTLVDHDGHSSITIDWQGRLMAAEDDEQTR